MVNANTDSFRSVGTSPVVIACAVIAVVALVLRVLLDGKEELHISEEHMNWLMYLQDIRGLPKEQRQKGNHPAEMLVLGLARGDLDWRSIVNPVSNKPLNI